MTQHLPSQEEPRPCLTNISDDDDDVVCGSEVEDNNTSTYQQHVLDVNDLGNYFADKVRWIMHAISHRYSGRCNGTM